MKTTHLRNYNTYNEYKEYDVHTQYSQRRMSVSWDLRVGDLRLLENYLVVMVMVTMFPIVLLLYGEHFEIFLQGKHQKGGMSGLNKFSRGGRAESVSDFWAAEFSSTGIL